MRLDTPVIPPAPALPEGGLRLGPPPTHLARLNACPRGRVGTTMAVTPTRVESLTTAAAAEAVRPAATPLQELIQTDHRNLTSHRVVRGDTLNEPVCCREYTGNDNVVRATVTILRNSRPENVARRDREITASLQARTREIESGRIEPAQRDAAGRGNTFYTRDAHGRIHLHLPVSEVLRNLGDPTRAFDEEIAAYKDAFNVLFEYCVMEGDSERARVAQDIRTHMVSVIEHNHRNLQERITRAMFNMGMVCLGAENERLRMMLDQANRIRAIQALTGMLAMAIMAGCFLGIGFTAGKLFR